VSSFAALRMTRSEGCQVLSPNISELVTSFGNYVGYAIQ
jgi:hypothetical protein